LIAKLNALEVLDLSNNQISTLPEEVSLLPKLKTLNLDANQLGIIPDAICKLAALEMLSVNENFLQEIPSTICNISTLKVLSFVGNKFLQYFSPQIVSKLPNLDIYSDAELVVPAWKFDNATATVNYLKYLENRNRSKTPVSVLAEEHYTTTDDPDWKCNGCNVKGSSSILHRKVIECFFLIFSSIFFLLMFFFFFHTRSTVHYVESCIVPTVLPREMPQFPSSSLLNNHASVLLVSFPSHNDEEGEKKKNKKKSRKKNTTLFPTPSFLFFFFVKRTHLLVSPSTTKLLESTSNLCTKAPTKDRQHSDEPNQTKKSLRKLLSLSRSTVHL
jgi:hypothetical protein